MVDFGLIDLQEAINEAETILGDKYTYFQSLITKYSVKPSKPFWDIIIFLTGLKVYKDTELFNKWINFWNKYSVSRKYIFGTSIQYQENTRTLFIILLLLFLLS